MLITVCGKRISIRVRSLKTLQKMYIISVLLPAYLIGARLINTKIRGARLTCRNKAYVGREL